MEERVESKKLMREMGLDEVLTFPISVLETIRNNVTVLNAKHYIEGKKWKSKAYKEEGVIRVSRVS